ncbi:MAG: M28 family peptidase [Solirubrobacterales bacterium]
MSAKPTAGSAAETTTATPLEWVRLLADEVGPRRPTGPAERLASELVRARLASGGLDAELEEFDGYSTFAGPYGIVTGLGLAAGVAPRSRPALRSALALAAAAALASEGRLTRTPVSDLLSRRRSQNVVATIEPRGEAKRTLCLVCHLDTSRSGLMFDPRFVRHLNTWLYAQSVACMVQAGEPLLGRFRAGRALTGAARAVLAAGVAVLAERELRGEDVPGGNDNASGVAVVASLALDLAAEPLDSTRVVVLMTGCEEAGMLGARAFLRSRDTSGWLFVNFDNVGSGTLRYLEREGLVQKWDADPALLALAAGVARDHPHTGLQPAGGPIGLTYDVTPVMARGGRALTFVAGDGGIIPNYHWPTDTADNVEPAALERALAAGRAMAAAIDAGEAD